MIAERRKALGIPLDHPIPPHFYGVYAIIITGLNDLLEQVVPGLTEEDHRKRLDDLATLACSIEPQLDTRQLDTLRPKFEELYDALVDPVPPEPIHWQVEIDIDVTRNTTPIPIWTVAQPPRTFHSYAEAYRAMRSRDDVKPTQIRVVPIYPTRS